MSNFVFVLDTQKRPLNPVQPGMARKLLTSGKAAVFRQYPFTIILKVEVTAIPDPITLKIDPGSKTTGIALVQGEKVVFGAELTHRGQAIKASLESRRSLRRSRRNRLAVRTTGSFNISAAIGLIQGIGNKYCSLIHRKDGYLYAT